MITTTNNTPRDLAVAKSPPCSQDAEMMVLGCMLQSINSLNSACSTLFEDDFFFSQHKILYRVMRSFYERDLPIDNLIVAEELKRLDALSAAGGISFIMTCSQFPGVSANVDEYIRIVQDRSVLRKIMSLSSVLCKKAAEDAPVAEELLEEAQKGFFDIGRMSKKNNFIEIRAILEGKTEHSTSPFMQQIEERQAYFQEHGKAMLTPGVLTGYIDLDAKIENFGNSNLIIIAARPAMGKTSFAMNIAENVAIGSKKSVGVFSLEMSADQLANRMLSSISGVTSKKIRSGDISGVEYQQLYESCEQLKECVIPIDDQSGISIGELRSRARRMKEVYDIGIIIIDYLQLLTGTGSKTSKENRQIEVSEISRNLKNIARELDIPVVCLSQLNRKSEERAGHRPLMSDLRDSGAIEQDADMIIFLHREEYYDPHSKPGQAEIIIAKNRHGDVGSIQLAFLKETTRFENLCKLPFNEIARNTFG